MNDIQTLNSQIAAQVINMYIFDITYTDMDSEKFRIAHTDDGYYVWPLFSIPKRTTKFKFEQICKMSGNFVADTDQRNFTINGWFSYDEFMDNFYNYRDAESLEFYIDRNFKNQTDFANSIKVAKQQITQWTSKKFIVVDDVMYSPRRELNKTYLNCSYVVAKIKSINDSRDDNTTVSDDETNEELLDVLAEFGIQDDEDSIADMFGQDGYEAIRDAEKGIY